MPRIEVETLSDGRQVTTETIIRECDGFTGSLGDLLDRIEARLPTREARRAADIALHDGHLVVSVTRVETDAEMHARRQRVAA